MRAVFICLIVMGHVSSQSASDFDAFLRGISYDYRERPKGKVDVNISILISNIASISEVTMDYEVQIFYRETWVDPRLAGFASTPDLALHESWMKNLWTPDTYVPNAIKFKGPEEGSLSHQGFIRVSPDGRILTSRRISLKLNCDQDLTLFPFDTQTCKIAFESYGNTDDLMALGWADAIAPLRIQYVNLPDFDLKTAFTMTRVEAFATGNYTRLHACFVLARSAGFCYLQLILPSISVVVTAWVCLWITNDSAFQNLIATLLAITFILFSYNQVMPRVSYLKAMDIWLGSCFMLVFIAFFKHAILLFFKNRVESGALLSRPATSATVHLSSAGSDLAWRRQTVSALVCTAKLVHVLHVCSQFLFIALFLLLGWIFFFGFSAFLKPAGDMDCDLASAYSMAEIVK